MLYIVHQDRVAAAAIELTPHQPERWARGQIVYFSTVYSGLPDHIDYAILMGLSGTGWHIEILSENFPRNPDSKAVSGVTVRILRKLKGDEETLQLINNYASRMVELTRKLSTLADKQGAA